MSFSFASSDFSFEPPYLKKEVRLAPISNALVVGIVVAAALLLLMVVGAVAYWQRWWWW
jgi:hypothetical protein